MLEVLHHRADRRPVLRSGTESATDGDLPAFARLDVVATAAVVVEIVRHRADDAVAVGDFRQLREVFADPQPRSPAADRAHWPADVGRRVRLHVEGFVLARAAEEEQEDHRLRPWLRASRRRLGGKHLRQRDSQEPCTTNLQHGATAEPPRHQTGSTEDLEHGGSVSRRAAPARHRTEAV